jgi:hypothetical protein
MTKGFGTMLSWKRTSMDIASPKQIEGGKTLLYDYILLKIL